MTIESVAHLYGYKLQTKTVSIDEIYDNRRKRVSAKWKYRHLADIFVVNWHIPVHIG